MNYCQRGQMENLIKLHKAQLASVPQRNGQSGAARSPHRRVLADAWPKRRDPANQSARQCRVRHYPRAPDQDRRTHDRASRTHPRPAADELPRGRIVPRVALRLMAYGPGVLGPRARRAADRGRSTQTRRTASCLTNDPSGRTASARPLTRRAKTPPVVHDPG
jgi:hypothetical protein